MTAATREREESRLLITNGGLSLARQRSGCRGRANCAGRVRQGMVATPGPCRSVVIVQDIWDFGKLGNAPPTTSRCTQKRNGLVHGFVGAFEEDAVPASFQNVELGARDPFVDDPGSRAARTAVQGSQPVFVTLEYEGRGRDVAEQAGDIGFGHGVACVTEDSQTRVSANGVLHP